MALKKIAYLKAPPQRSGQLFYYMPKDVFSLKFIKLLKKKENHRNDLYPKHMLLKKYELC